jgi:hypothetical protein
MDIFDNKETIMMNIVRLVMISSVVLFSTDSYSGAHSRQRSHSNPVSYYQNAATSHSRRCMRGEWIKRRRNSFDSIQALLAENNIRKVNGNFLYSRKVLMVALAERRLKSDKKK